MGGACSKYEGREGVCTGETWGKETAGETQPRWEDDIKMELQEVGCGGIDWIEMAQDRDR